MIIEKFRIEWIEYEMIDLVSESSIRIKSAPVAAEGRRVWAVVDVGIGPVSGEGTGEIVLIDQLNGEFRVVGQRFRPLCKFERWSSDLAFFIRCLSLLDNPQEAEGEFRVTPGLNRSLELMLSPRRIPNAELRSIVEPEDGP